MYPTKKLPQILTKDDFSIGKIKTQDYISEGDFAIVDQGKNLIGGYSNEKDLVYTGKLPVIVYGDHTNIVKYIDFPFIGGADGIKVFSFQKDIDTKYAFYLLEHFKPETQGYRRHYSLLKDIYLPLPPLSTQSRIVARLDSAFASIDEQISLLRVNIRDVESMRKSVLEESFQNGEYEKVYLGNKEFIEIIDGDRGANYPKKTEFTESGFCLFLNTSNVRQGFFDFSKMDFITEEKYNKMGKGKVYKNDVILTTRGTIGNSAFVENNFPYDNIRINSGMVILRNNIEKVSPKYLIHFINSPLFEDQKEKFTSGSAQPQLPITVMKRIFIPLPPLSRQHEIVAHLDRVFATTEALRGEYEAQIRDLQTLKQSLLEEAFAGRLVTENEA